MIKIMKYGEVEKDAIFARVEPTVNVEAVVAEIIADVRKNGDAALFAYTETLNPAQLSRIQSVVDSVVLEGEPEEASAPAEPFLYTDEQTWVSFWVPAGWSETELVGDAEVLKCGFVSGEPDTAIIYYGNSDLYEEVSELGEYSR